MPKATPSRNPNPSDPPARPLRWGMVATGTIARKFVQDLHASGVGTAVAVGSRDLGRAQEFARTWGVPRAYGSYAEVAQDPEVEAVYVATPHSFHFADALECLRNRKAVLCEKPLTLDLDQATRLFAAAEDHGVFLMEALWTFFLPAMDQARQWLRDGAIGEVTLIEAHFGFSSRFDPQSRLFDPQLGGGALLDVGVYTVALAQAVAGLRPPRIKASARKAPTGVDETTSILLDWSSGVRAQLTCSVVHDLGDRARIYGTRGTITLPEFWRAPTAILETAQGTTTFHDKRTTLGYEGEARAVADHLAAGRREDPLVSKAFSLRLATTLDAVRKQIRVTYPSPQVKPAMVRGSSTSSTSAGESSLLAKIRSRIDRS